MPSELSPTSEAATLRRFEVTHELVLAAVLCAEIVVFSAIGTNFLTRANAFEITRLAVEVGLLAVAMTPVIVTGGIDLSVGSLMGLSRRAVRRHCIATSAGRFPRRRSATLLMGAAAGGLNALLITRLRLPPLIVTLGTFSLFRGLGEGFTRGFENYSQFPDSFLFLGQGYLMARRADAVADFCCRGDWFLDSAAAHDDWPRTVCDRLLGRRRSARRHSGRAATQPWSTSCRD